MAHTKDDRTEGAQTVPAFSGVELVLFPGAACSILVNSRRAWNALSVAVHQRTEPLVALFAANAARDPEPDPNDLYDVGTLARIHDLSKRPCCGKWVANIEGLVRVRCCNYVREAPYREARVECVLDSLEDSTLQHSLALAVEQAVLKFRSLYPECHHTANAIGRLQAVSEPSDVPGAVAGLLLCVPVCERQKLLEMTSVTARLETVLGHLHQFLSAAGARPTVH